jgi:hypothetical protein
MNAGKKLNVRAQLRIAAERLRMPSVGELPAGPLTANELDKAAVVVKTLIDKAETASKLLHNFIAAGVVSESYRPHLDELNAALADMGEEA